MDSKKAREDKETLREIIFNWNSYRLEWFENVGIVSNGETGEFEFSIEYKGDDGKEGFDRNRQHKADMATRNKMYMMGEILNGNAE